MTEEILVTAGGLAALEAEIEHLRESCRGGDDEQALDVERGRLARLEARLRAAEVAEPEEDGRVGIGERVTLRHISSGAMTSYRIVGVGEADPAAGEISYRSPIGSAVLGRGAGDVVEADAPSGRLRLEIVAVEE